MEPSRVTQMLTSTIEKITQSYPNTRLSRLLISAVPADISFRDLPDETLLKYLLEKYEGDIEDPDPVPASVVELYLSDSNRPPGHTGLKVNTTSVWVKIRDEWYIVTEERSWHNVLTSFKDSVNMEKWPDSHEN